MEYSTTWNLHRCEMEATEVKAITPQIIRP